MKFLEFFAGGGMVRAGLGEAWSCVLANDIDYKKISSYTRNWGESAVVHSDVALLDSNEIEHADLAWASFPCQDLSQAGAGAGLRGVRSGTFWPFWRHVKTLNACNKKPNLIVLENVPGAITSHGGMDFRAICEAMVAEGYRVGALLIDASLFLPQSRLRLFIIAVSSSMEIADSLRSSAPVRPWHSKSLINAAGCLDIEPNRDWIWWNLPLPPVRASKLIEFILDDADVDSWHDVDETKKIIGMMAPLHLDKVRAAQSTGKRIVGTVYKRRRIDSSGKKIQRAEVRFDDLAGCLRTPTGGSSRQTLLVVNGNSVRSRFLQPNEAAKLMGLSDNYTLPANYYEAYHLVGDGVAVPVVSFLAENLLEPLLDHAHRPC